MPQKEQDNDIRQTLESLTKIEIPLGLQNRVLQAVHEEQKITAAWERWRQRVVVFSTATAILGLWLFSYNLAGSGMGELMETVTRNPDVIPSLGTDLLLGFLEALPIGSLVILLGALAVRISSRAIKFTSKSIYHSQFHFS